MTLVVCEPLLSPPRDGTDKLLLLVSLIPVVYPRLSTYVS